MLLAIVADDLTGAADTGAPFAEAGLSTVIPLSGDGHPAADVVVLSTESRDMDAPSAARAVSMTVSRLLSGHEASGPRWLYKKIDSALRGHPRDELLAAMSAADETRALVAPAFPPQGRTTIVGRQYIDGVPLELSRLGSPNSTSDLLALFNNDQGLPVRHLPLDTVRSQSGAIHRFLDDIADGVVVADAETDADLLALAQAAKQSSFRVLCGAAGLARHLAGLLAQPTAARPPFALASRNGPVLVVAGSRHAATERQIEALQDAGTPIVRPSQELLDNPDLPVDATVAEVAARLSGGETTVLTTLGLAPCPRGGQTVAARLAEIVAALPVRSQIGGLGLTGGDVAAAVCSALGASALWLGGEISPGLPWGALAGGTLPGLPIATKAGSFGSDDALLNIVDHLNTNGH